MTVDHTVARSYDNYQMKGVLVINIGECTFWVSFSIKAYNWF